MLRAGLQEHVEQFQYHNVTGALSQYRTWQHSLFQYHVSVPDMAWKLACYAYGVRCAGGS
eukprot:978115-Rhodomonas_salina.1